MAFPDHLSLFLLLLVVFKVQSQNECSLPGVVLRYGLLTPPELNPATGSSIVLTCESGSETNFVWQKDTNELLNTGASFVIASVAVGDGGVYRCGVMECNDTVFSSQIVINTVPAISLLVGPESPVAEGGVVTLFCSAQGWPTPTYTWLFEGSIVSMSQTYTISSITPAQEGTYQCVVMNNRGEDTGNRTVSVIAWPTFSTPEPESTESTDTMSTQPTDGTASSGQASTGQTDDYGNMGTLTTTAASVLSANITGVPFIFVLVIILELSVGVLLIFFIMGCLCCTELCRVKARRGSDEIALLPRDKEEEASDNGYGNVDEVKGGVSCVNMGFKDQPTALDPSVQNSTDHKPVQAQRYTSAEGKNSVSLSNGKSRSSDKEPLISLDDPEEEGRKQRKSGGKKTRRTKSETTPSPPPQSTPSPPPQGTPPPPPQSAPPPPPQSTPSPPPQSTPPPPPQSAPPPSTEVPVELPLAAASQATPTVTAMSAEDETVVISKNTGETTVTMDTAETSSSLDDTAEWESFPEANEVPTEQEQSVRSSTVAERAKKLGRTPSFVEQLMRSHPLGVAEIVDLVYNPDYYVGTHPLLEEYRSIPSNSAKLTNLLPIEMLKNRYRNVLPNAHSRVPLKDLGEQGSTYINANYIRGYGDKEKAYIATQGPIYESMNDFWRMVWEQEVYVIIMITGIIERGMHKCTKYWPDADESSPMMYGNVAVKNNFEEKTSVGVVSYLTLTTEEGEREVYHFWCTTWPDFGVPKETGSILTFRKMVDDSHKQAGCDKPLLIHCSAGLGRTGTFIAIDMGIQQFEKEGKVDPLKYICEMRQDRGGIIQTPEQYLFVHNALADFMETN